MRNFLFFLAVAGLTSAACADRDSADAGAGTVPGAPEAALAAHPGVDPSATTAPLADGSLVNAAFLAGRSGDTYIVGAAGVAGLDLYRPDGSHAGNRDDIEAGMVTAVPATAARGAVVIAYDGLTSTLRAFELVAGEAALDDVMPAPVPVADEVVGLCHYRSALSGTDSVYAVTDAGLILHYELYEAGGGLAARLLRSIPSAKGSGFCVTDPRDGSLYLSEESTGIWRLDAEAETDTNREPVDLRAPFGSLSDDIKGIGLYAAGARTAYLLVADIGNERLSVYRVPDGELAGHLTVTGLVEPEGVTIAAAGVAGHDGGLVAIADESLDAGGSDLKLVAWRTIAAALTLESAGTLPTLDAPVVVRPVFETDVIPTYGDAADDPAIWVHPDNAADSLVIGTGKKSGLYVFDLEGHTLQELPDGRMNNVDVRDAFMLGGEPVPIVAASNRSNDSIALYRIDAATRRLVDIADGVLDTGFGDPYGLCLYRSAGGDHYVFVNEGGDGLTRQWRLVDNGNGRVGIDLVREIAVGSQAEGCVADDANGALYIAEEDAGLWKYSAEPDGGDARTAIDSTGDDGRLTDDVEGVALYARPDGTGYLVASNQGANNYAVYRREGDNAFVGMFHVVANTAAGIDGASETDGLDVSAAALGAKFGDGLLVVQDGRNIAPEERQNFKYVAWADIAEALGIDRTPTGE